MFLPTSIFIKLGLKSELTLTFFLGLPSRLSWYQSIKATMHFDISI